MVNAGSLSPIINIAQNDRDKVDTFIDDLIAQHSSNAEMMNIMALEATSLITSVSSRSHALENQGMLARLLGRFSGKNQKISARNSFDLARSQYLGQQLLNKLAENNLITYQMTVALSNRVNRVIADVSDLQHDVAELHQSLAVFFGSMRETLEARFTNLERNDDLLFWKETIEFTPVYNGKIYQQLSLPEKIVCLANEFYHHSHQQWRPRDLAFLKSVMVQVGHHPDENVQLKEIYQTYQSTPLILEQLFKGVDDHFETDDIQVTSPLLMGFSKLQSLANEQAHVVDTILTYAPDTNKQEVSFSLMSKSIQQEALLNLEHEISFFDAVFNLVEELVIYNQMQIAKAQLQQQEKLKIEQQEKISVEQEQEKALIASTKIQVERNQFTEHPNFERLIQGNIGKLKVIIIGAVSGQKIAADEKVDIISGSSPCILIDMYGIRKSKFLDQIGSLDGGVLLLDDTATCLDGNYEQEKHLKNILPKVFSKISLIPGSPNGLDGPFCLIVLDLFDTIENGIIEQHDKIAVKIVDYSYPDERNRFYIELDANPKDRTLNNLKLRDSLLRQLSTGLS